MTQFPFFGGPLHGEIRDVPGYSGSFEICRATPSHRLAASWLGETTPEPLLVHRDRYQRRSYKIPSRLPGVVMYLEMFVHESTIDDSKALKYAEEYVRSNRKF